MSAGVVNADTNGGDGDHADDAAEHSQLNVDDLRLRLDSPLFAREPGLAAAVPVPGLRELTWEHVINPTSQHQIITGDAPPPGDDTPRPTPIRIEDLLARPEPALSPLPEPVVEPLAPVASITPSATPTPSGLPSFAAMLSGEVETTAAAPSWSDDHLADEGLVKPIEEPPPVARDTDPAVKGLAELISKSTPSVGTPRVEALVDPEPASFEPPVVDAPAEFAAAQPPPMGPSTMSPPLVRDTGMQPVVAGSAVEAEMNRLAYVPDLQDDAVGPVEVPEIAYSDVRSAEPVAAASDVGTPTLSQHDMFMPRQAVAAARRHAYSDVVTQSAPAVRRRKRHFLRKFLTTLVLLGMVAGGLFAAKYFVLDRVKWAGDIAPLASAVENARGLHFDHDIPVTTLASPDYSTKIVESLGGITSDSLASTQSQWRAVGVASGSFDRGAIGLAATIDSPAFYDPATSTIYVVDGLQPEMRTFALHRALTMALLDQQFKWSSQLTQAAPAVVLGTRAVFDADALAVATRLLTDSEREKIPGQQFGMITDYKIGGSPAPFGTAAIARMGVGLWPYLDRLSNADRDALEKQGVMTDDHALDLRRMTSGATDTVGTTTQGMLFWYHALAGRLDDDVAWRVALGWRGDDLTVDNTTATPCVSANIDIDGTTAPAALAAFNAWAAAAPPASLTTVAMTPGTDGTSRIVVHACDPGVAVPTNDGTPQLSLGGAPLRVEQFRRLLGAHADLAPAQAACAVYGPDSVTVNDERGLVDAAQGWAAPGNHPVPDPAAMNCPATVSATPTVTPKP